jgi:hypothetical protein
MQPRDDSSRATAASGAFITELTESLFSWVLPVLSVFSVVKSNLAPAELLREGNSLPKRAFWYAFPFASDGETNFSERHKLGG